MNAERSHLEDSGDESRQVLLQGLHANSLAQQAAALRCWPPALQQLPLPYDTLCYDPSSQIASRGTFEERGLISHLMAKTLIS